MRSAARRPRRPRGATLPPVTRAHRAATGVRTTRRDGRLGAGAACSSSTWVTLGKDAPVLLLPDRGAPETEPRAWGGPRRALALSDRHRDDRCRGWNRRQWESPATTSHGSTAGVRTIAGTDAIDQRRTDPARVIRRSPAHRPVPAAVIARSTS